MLAVRQIETTPPNNAVLVTAARLRMLLDLKSLVWAAARDGQRSAPPKKQRR
jgi:hypothetical protein